MKPLIGATLRCTSCGCDPRVACTRCRSGDCRTCHLGPAARAVELRLVRVEYLPVPAAAFEVEPPEDVLRRLRRALAESLAVPARLLGGQR